jgi:hypothetical protein
MRSRLLLLAAVVGALLFAAGCENPAAPDAASVNGTGISRDALYDEAEAWNGIVAADGGPEFALGTDLPGSYSTDGLAALLTTMIQRTLIEDAAEGFGIELDEAALGELRGADLGGYGALDEETLDRFLRYNVIVGQVLDYTEQNEWWTDEQAEQFSALLTCTRHILVETEAEADDIIEQLEDGADFAELASSSIDTASAEVGGDLGCNPAGTFVDEFDEAIADAEPGDILGPVETEFGFHVITVYEPDSPIEPVGSDGWVRFVLGTAKVDIDPRFGRWDDAISSVVAPEGAVSPSPEDSTVVQ